MKTIKTILTFCMLCFFSSVQAFASLDEAIATTGQGAVEFPLGLVKLVGGILWTVGEVIALPFKVLF